MRSFLRRRAFPLAAPTWPGGVERPPEERRTGVDFETDWARRQSVRFARAVVLDGVTRPAIRALAAPQVTGTDRLGEVKAPVVFAANHASHVDTPLLLTVLPERFRHKAVVGAGADYFFDKRWKGAIWAFAINAIPIERSRVSPRSLRLAQQMLQEGWSLVIFPEGGRSPEGWSQPHRAGAAYLAVKARVPVVPVHIEGTRRILRKGSGKIRRSTTAVTFGSPMWAAEDEDPRDFAARIERAIAVLADEQSSDWWTATRRAAAGTTPRLTGPEVSAWRRTWALGEGRRSASNGRSKRAWP